MDEAVQGSDYAPMLMTQATSWPPAPGEYRIDAAQVPSTQDYEGGGIFSASTPGPADNEVRTPLSGGSRGAPSEGSDFGPPAVEAPRLVPSLPFPGMPMPGQPMPGPTQHRPHPTFPPVMASPVTPNVGIPRRFIPSSGPTTLPVQFPMDQMPPEFLETQAVGVMNHEGSHMLGLSVLTFAVGAAAGTYYSRSAYGGIAGSLFAGAALNAYRAFHYYQTATEEDDEEAKISGTYAVAAAGLGAFIWHKFVEPKRATPNKGDYEENTEACNIRPVGP